MSKIDPYKVMTKCCKSCVLHPEEDKRIHLENGRICEIKANAIRGINQMCHCSKDNSIVCRGVRDYQVKMFYRMGLIKEETEESLLSTMEQVLSKA